MASRMLCVTIIAVRWLIAKFSENSGEEFSNDRALLS